MYLSNVAGATFQDQSSGTNRYGGFQLAEAAEAAGTSKSAVWRAVRSGRMSAERPILPAGRDCPALIDVVHGPRLSAHVAETGHGRASRILGRHRVSPHDGNFCSDVQIPLWREPEWCLQSGRTACWVGPFLVVPSSTSRTWGFSKRSRGSILPKACVGSSPVPFTRSGRYDRKNRTDDAHSPSERSATRNGEGTTARLTPLLRVASGGSMTR